MLASRATSVRRLRGFTMVELIVVLFMMAVLAAMSMGQTSRLITGWRVARAGQAMSEEIQSAYAYVGRNRKPLIITLDTVNMELREVDRNGIIYRRRSFGRYSEYKLNSTNLAISPALTMEIYPPGLAAGTLSVAITVNKSSRRVRMLRGGLVQVCASNVTTRCD